MRAAIWKGPGRWTWAPCRTRSAPSDGVLLHVLACGICGTDVRSFYNGDRRIEPPWVLGHEISGEVVEIGPTRRGRGRRERHLGRRRRALHLDAVVRALPHVPRRRREPLPHGELMGFDYPGAYAERVAIPEHRAQEPVPHPRRAVARARDVRRPAVGRDLRPQGHRDRPRRRRRRDRRRPGRHRARRAGAAAGRRPGAAARAHARTGSSSRDAILGDDRVAYVDTEDDRRHRRGHARRRTASAPTS